MKTTIVLNFIRSANAPQIRAGVMMKNMHWNNMKLAAGIGRVPGKFAVTDSWVVLRSM